MALKNLFALNPSTGDPNKAWIFIILIAVALLIVAGVIVWRIKSGKNEPDDKPANKPLNIKKPRSKKAKPADSGDDE